mgnify:CR=1 FL=1
MSDKPVVTMQSLAERVFAESKFRPQLYNHGFVEDVARAMHVAKLEGISQERARIVKLLEAEQLEWRAGTSHDDLLERLLKLVRQP